MPPRSLISLLNKTSHHTIYLPESLIAFEVMIKFVWKLYSWTGEYTYTTVYCVLAVGSSPHFWNQAFWKYIRPLYYFCFFFKGQRFLLTLNLVKKNLANLSHWIHSQERIFQDLQRCVLARVDKCPPEDVIYFGGGCHSVCDLSVWAREQWDNCNNTKTPGFLPEELWSALARTRAPTWL